MRIFGFLSLIFGFILLCFFILQIQGPIPRAVVSKYYDTIGKEPKEEISKEAARSFVLNAVDDSLKKSSRFLIPSLMMLSGGLILAYSPRKKEKSK